MAQNFGLFNQNYSVIWRKEKKKERKRKVTNNKIINDPNILFIANFPSLQNRKYNSGRIANRAKNGKTNQVRRGIEKKRKEKTNYRREKETSDTR